MKTAKDIIAEMLIKLDHDGEVHTTHHTLFFYLGLSQRIIDKLAENGFKIISQTPLK